MSFWKGVRVVVFGTILLSPVVSLAADGLPKKLVPCDGANCTVCDLATLAQNILNTSIFILIVLSAVLFAWAGWKMMTSGGNAGEYAAGKRMFASVFIGLVIILGAWIVVDTLMKTIYNESKFGPWNKICQIVENIESHFERHFA